MSEQKKLIEYIDAEIKRDGQEILHDINLTLYSGDFYTLEGPIGSGKTSLFKTFFADLPFTAQKAEVLDFNLLKLPARKIPKLRRRIGIVFQNYLLFDNKTVFDNLKFVTDSLNFKPNVGTISDHIHSVLTKVGMDSKSETFPHMLSGGEKQSVAIARAIVCHPDIILADEPTGNLDENSALHIASLLKSLANEGAGVIAATHDENAFKNQEHKILKIQNGTII